jgi:hypothetical protein
MSRSAQINAVWNGPRRYPDPALAGVAAIRFDIAPSDRLNGELAAPSSNFGRAELRKARDRGRQTVRFDVGRRGSGRPMEARSKSWASIDTERPRRHRLTGVASLRKRRRQSTSIATELSAVRTRGYSIG